VVQAERVDRDGSSYQAVADLTALVHTEGSGTWMLGGIQVGTGTNAYGGWSLVVVYRDPGAPLRSVAVLDGFVPVDSSTSTVFDVGGFRVPTDGAPAATVDVFTYEGDAEITGDQLVVGGEPLTDASNPLGNSFNSTRSSHGRKVADPARGDLPFIGIDLDRFDVAKVLPPGSRSTTVRFETAGDRYFTGALAVCVDL